MQKVETNSDNPGHENFRAPWPFRPHSMAKQLQWSKAAPRQEPPETLCLAAAVWVLNTEGGIPVGTDFGHGKCIFFAHRTHLSFFSLCL